VYLVLEFIIEKTATVDQIYVDVSWRFVWGNKKKIALSNVTQIHGDSSATVSIAKTVRRTLLV
jgi:hypothetical protein